MAIIITFLLLILITTLTSIVTLWYYGRNVKNRSMNIRYFLTQGKNVSQLNNISYTIYKTIIIRLMQYVIKRNPNIHFCLCLWLILIQLVELYKISQYHLTLFDLHVSLVLKMMLVSCIAGLCLDASYIFHKQIKLLNSLYWQAITIIWNIYYVCFAPY